MIPREAYAMSETQLMEHIRGACKQLGLLAFHCYDSRRSWGPGFPDLVIAGSEGVLFVECKRQGESLSTDQAKWSRYLRESGQAWCLWRPSDWLNGSVVADLAKLSSKPVMVFTAEDM